jgi:multidrug efflux pump subunit AcrA (membrane-fusion protein)
MKKSLKIVFILLAIIVVAGSIYLYLQRPKKVEPEVEGIEIGEAIPVKVTIAKIHTLTNYIQTEGITSAERYWQAVAEVSGTVEKINFQDGDFVEEGKLIMKLKNEELEQQLISASIQYQKKYAEYLSLKQIIPGMIEEVDVDLAEIIAQSNDCEDLRKQLEHIISGDIESGEPQKYVTVKEALADLERLYAQYNKLSFYAPFSGTLGDLYLKEGNFVSAGNTVFRLIDLDKLVVNVTVMETEFVRLQPNAKAYLRFLAYPEDLVEGKILSINPFIEENSRLGRVKIGFDNPEHKITVGMFAECYLTAEKFPDLLLVPNNAILTREDKELVFTVKNGRSYWNYVKTGRSNEFYTEILEGLEPQDSVVIEGHYTLIHDAKLDVTEVIPLETFSIEGRVK